MGVGQGWQREVKRGIVEKCIGLIGFPISGWYHRQRSFRFSFRQEPTFSCLNPTMA